MKTNFFILLLISISFLSCFHKNSESSSSGETGGTSTCDSGLTKFTPPSGKQDGAAENSAGERRILMATSTDGLTFTRTNTILSDQANTPNMITYDDGTINVYYTGAELDGSNDGIGVAVSSDLGSTWEYCLVNFIDFPEGVRQVDPDIVRNSDGTYTMYTTSGIGSSGDIGIYYSTSNDGYNFTYGGLSFDHTEAILDSLTMIIDGAYHQYVLKGASAEFVYATSGDGTSFDYMEDQIPQIDSKTYILSNWMHLDEGFRIYAFSLENNDIKSFTTTNGQTLTAESGQRLAFDSSNSQESSFVKDAAVVELSDGTYLMTYVSEIP